MRARPARDAAIAVMNGDTLLRQRTFERALPFLVLCRSAPVDGRLLALAARCDSVLTGGRGVIEPLTSPCHCIVRDHLAQDGELLQEGEPAFALIRAGEVPVIRAQLPLAETERLEVGDRALIRIPAAARR